MFVGHYGPAAAVAGGKLRLWHCFVAVQFLDILWAPLVLGGVEHVRITPNFTQSNHLDLYHMPYTHSLVMAVIWSVVAGGAYRFIKRGAGPGAAVLIGALVFSHWILDFVTHRPDLELWFGGPKVGLGLWENRSVSFGLEVGLFLAGLAIYWMRTSAKGMAGRLTLPLMIALGVAAQYFGNWGPPPPGPQAAAMTAIIAYAVFAGLAALIDGTRRPKTA